MLGPLAPILVAPQPFVLRAEAVPSADRLRIRLSVTNVSPQPQTLWMATPSCTASRWRVTPPEINIVDYSLAVSATCPLACQHRRTLKPGETFVRTVEPVMPRRQKFVYEGQKREYGLRPGPLRMTFRLLQPNITTTASSPRFPDGHIYGRTTVTSNPIQVDVKPKWLH